MNCKHQLELHFDYDVCLLCGEKVWHKEDDGSRLITMGLVKDNGIETLDTSKRSAISLRVENDL